MAANFKVFSYTGNGTTQSFSIGFQPDLVVINSFGNGEFYDSSNGVNKYSIFGSTQGLVSGANTVTAFNATGFSIGSSTQVNANGGSYTAFCWQKGALLDIEQFTGTGAALNTSHSLGSVPQMIINNDNSAANNNGTALYNSNLGVTSPQSHLYYWDGTAVAATVSTTAWNNTLPTSSVFSVGANNSTNLSGDIFTNYLFGTVSGMSAFGTYTGNGSVSGPSVTGLGFTPALVIITPQLATSLAKANFNWVWGPNLSWQMDLMTNVTTNDVNFVSGGFNMVSTNSDYNTNGTVYTYAAFANSASSATGMPWLPQYPNNRLSSAFPVLESSVVAAPLPLNLKMPWRPNYPTIIQQSLQQLVSGMVEPILALNFKLPWLPDYPTIIQTFMQQLPSGEAFAPVLALNLPVKWFPKYPDQTFTVWPKPISYFSEPILPLNFLIPWLPTFPDAVRETPRVKGDSVFQVPYPLNKVLPWLPQYADQIRLNLALQRDFIFAPTLALNLPLLWLPDYPDLYREPPRVKGDSLFETPLPISALISWLPQYIDLVREVPRVKGDSLFETPQPLHYLLNWLPDFPNQIITPVPPVFAESFMPIAAKVPNIGWFPDYPDMPRPIYAPQNTDFATPIFPVVIPPLPWFPSYPDQARTGLLTASMLSPMPTQVFPIPVTPGSGGKYQWPLSARRMSGRRIIPS